MKNPSSWTTRVGKRDKRSLSKGNFLGPLIDRIVICLFGVATLLWMPQASKAQSVKPSTHETTCRDSRIPQKSNWPLDEAGTRRLHLEVDVDGDGLADVLEAKYSSGSASASTSVEIALGTSADKLRAEEAFDFSEIMAVNPVPKEPLNPRHRAALKWVEEILFPRICESPYPSLVWLLDPKKRLTWIEGPPKMPDFYAIRLPLRRLAGTALKRLNDAKGRRGVSPF